MCFKTTIFFVFVLILIPHSTPNNYEHFYSSTNNHQKNKNNYSDGNWRQVLRSAANDKSLQTLKCVDIPQNFTLCHDIQYKSMRLPNLLDHESVDEIIQESEPWNNLIKLYCHPDTKLFLCSLFAPICFPNLDKYILPCQSMCLAVKKDCESRMKQYNFPWPEMLKCRFPEDNDMCIKPVTSKKNLNKEKVCKSCAQMPTFENIMDNYCRSNIVLKGRIKYQNMSHVTVTKFRIFKNFSNKIEFNNKILRFPKQYAINKITFRLSNSKCLCLNNKNSSQKLKQNYLIMLTDNSKNAKKAKKNNETIEAKKANIETVKTTKHYTAQFFLPWKQNDKIFKSVIRKFKKINCKTLGREVHESVLRRKKF